MPLERAEGTCRYEQLAELIGGQANDGQDIS
jgi:hypothetical protein